MRSDPCVPLARPDAPTLAAPTLVSRSPLRPLCHARRSDPCVPLAAPTLVWRPRPHLPVPLVDDADDAEDEQEEEEGGVDAEDDALEALEGRDGQAGRAGVLDNRLDDAVKAGKSNEGKGEEELVQVVADDAGRVELERLAPDRGAAAADGNVRGPRARLGPPLPPSHR